MAWTALGAAPGAWAAATFPGLSVTSIAPGVWLHKSWKRLANGEPFPSNGLIVSGRRRALIVDTTWPTEDMRPL
ncbi:MAG: hypothetical protein ACLFV8_08060, partial [Alphaproteobacteria bacterium]